MAGYDLTQTPLAGVATVTLQSWLSDAQAALAALNTGRREVTVIVTGGGQHREVTFQKTDQAALLNWIRMLQAQLGIIATTRRPIWPRF
jgi:hypothetical protein